MPVKPTQQEEEFFARQELERLRKLVGERQSQLASEEKEQLKALHYMHCPKCGMELVEVQYQQVRIDCCSNCEGVWLDKGELRQLTGTLADRFFRLFRQD